MDDLISRADAIEAVQNRRFTLSKEKVLLINDLEKLPSAQLATDKNVGAKLGTNLAEVGTDLATKLNMPKYELPSAQSEIIRCKDCGKREVCRTSTVWAVAPSDDWFCADAERREDG